MTMPGISLQQLQDIQASAVLDNVPDIVVRYSIDGRYLYINKAGAILQ